MATPTEPTQPTQAPRMSILCVGFRRRPFSISLADANLAPHVRLNSVALHLGIADYGLAGMRSSNPRLRRHGNCWFGDTMKTFHVRLYVAVASGTRDYLQLDHPYTTVLMQIENQADCDKLLESYTTLENDVTDCKKLINRLAEMDHVDPETWGRIEDDRIHVLAVLVRGWHYPSVPHHISSLSQLDLDYQFGASRVLWRLDREKYSSMKPFLHGAIDDLLFHGDATVNPSRQYELMRMLHPASLSDHPLAALPRFDRVAFTRAFCPQHQTPAPKASGPLPQLQHLTKDAALRAMLHEDPPQFVDAIDCIMEAALYKDSERVAQDVLCFVKFDCGEEDAKMSDSLYVSPRMLATLDIITTLGDASRPRLLVFVFLRPLRERVGRIDLACLPACFPSIAVRQPAGYY